MMVVQEILELFCKLVASFVEGNGPYGAVGSHWIPISRPQIRAPTLIPQSPLLLHRYDCNVHGFELVIGPTW
ncbi:unnamed protein product [Urochloa humidicola]